MTDLPAGTEDDGAFWQPKASLAVGSVPTNGEATPPASTFESRPIQINNRDSAGPNRPYVDNASLGYSTPVAVAQNSLFSPLGEFARDGDLLQVPFIGSYVIYSVSSNNLDPGANTLVEMNSVSMDSVEAQYQAPSAIGSNAYCTSQYDIDTTYGTKFHNEQIGHFCPMGPNSTGYSSANTDFLDDPADAKLSTFQKSWTYHWAKRLFDFVTVQSPQDDYIPNVDPAMTSDGAVSGDPSLLSTASPKPYPKYPPSNFVSNPPASRGPYYPAPVPNGPVIRTTANSNLGREETAPVEGRVNINTANALVLSAVPFYSPAWDGRISRR